MMPVEEAHQICNRLEGEIIGAVPSVHIIVHCEPCVAVDGKECPPDCPSTYQPGKLGQP
jgi:divalent metal cation (Fe/Co/Zn/Cd) transporter